MEHPLVTTAAVLFVSLSLVYYIASPTSKRLPGPRRLPLIGNAHLVPKEHSWITFAKWQKVYGDVIYLDIFGRPILVINSRKIANDLLDKRSAIYSNRAHTEMIKLCEFTESFPVQQYGDDFRKQRRFVAPYFAPSYVHNYAAFQQKEMGLLVQSVLNNPSVLSAELKFRMGKLIMRTVYGYDPQSENDVLLARGFETSDNFSIACARGAWLVDAVPILRFIPRWMPGSGFLAFSERVKKKLWKTCWEPYQWRAEALIPPKNTDQVFQPNMISNILRNAGTDITGTHDEYQAAWAGFSMFGGGLDTKITTLLTFLLCMVLNPDVQKKAQAEIDTIVGKTRLPRISDRESLPYVRSILAETLRWAPPTPISVPHVLTKDDIYEGYDIKKGTPVIANIWGMLHDPEIYPDPMAFKPERFNGDDSAMEEIDIVFGFGRRICPGQYFAEGTLFAAMATFLATCEILPALDEAGKEIIPNPKYNSEIISAPEPFPIRFKARSPQAEALLADACE